MRYAVQLRLFLIRFLLQQIDRKKEIVLSGAIADNSMRGLYAFTPHSEVTPPVLLGFTTSFTLRQHFFPSENYDHGAMAIQFGFN